MLPAVGRLTGHAVDDRVRTSSHDWSDSRNVHRDLQQRGPALGRVWGANNRKQPDTVGQRRTQRRSARDRPRAGQGPFVRDGQPCVSTTVPSPGGQTSGIASNQNGLQLGQVGRVWHPPGPTRATTRQPGGRAVQSTHRSRRGLPPDCRVVGLRQGAGMPHDSERPRS